MKILKEAFITKTSIDDIVEMAEKHPVAIERLKKIRDQKKEGYFEDLVKDIYPNGVALENLFDLLETDADLVEEEIGIKFEVNEALTQSDKYIPHLRGRSFHTMTKDRKFDVDVDEEGNVVASERPIPGRYFSGNISDKVNDFPYTDEDNIILAAREQHKRNFGKDESLKESSLKETAYGKDELWNQINNTEYAYNALARKVKECIEKGLPKEYIVTAVRKEIYSMKDDFGRLPTTQAERQELAQDFVEDELQGYSFEADPSVPSYRARGKWVKESLSEGFKIGSQDIQSVKVYNPYNYTIQELRINNRDKTFERGTFTMGKPDKKTHNRQEYEDVVDELLSKGYKEIPSDWKSLRNKTRKGFPTRNESLKESREPMSEVDNYYIASFYDTNFRGIEEATQTNDFDEVKEFAWDKLQKGFPIKVTNMQSGENTFILPDDIGFEGDYPFGTLEDKIEFLREPVTGTFKMKPRRLKKESIKESSYDDDEDDEEMSVVSALNSLSPRQKKRLADRGAFIRDVADEPLKEANLSDVERQLERAKSAGDDTQAWDLAMCIENDESIYDRFVTPAIKNLQRKNKRGIFDRTLAVQLFYYVVENSLKYGPRWFPYKLKDVTVPTRYLAADELVDFYEDELKEKE